MYRSYDSSSVKNACKDVDVIIATMGTGLLCGGAYIG